MIKLEDLEVYKLSMNVAEDVWQLVIKWDYFCKKTVGEQFIKSVDSIAANIAEGFGRFHYKENKNFAYYARGSLTESICWLIKSKNRNLISLEMYQNIMNSFDLIHKKLNAYIKSIGQKKTY